MCGIVGFVRKHKTLDKADLSALVDQLKELESTLNAKDYLSLDFLQLKEYVDETLSVNGAIALVSSPNLRNELSLVSNNIRISVEKALEDDDSLSEEDREKLVLLNDALWQISRDACSSAEQIYDLIKEYGDPAIASFTLIAIFRSVNLVLRSIDRIEVRGRDSAGITIALQGTQLTNDITDNYEHISSSNNVTYFTYRRAAEIGELGDNVSHIRESIKADEILFDVISTNESCHEMILAHTRWASMGVISDANTHPLDSIEVSKSKTTFSVGALNGDIDNHAELRSECSIDPSITTDAKLIPVLFANERQVNSSHSIVDSFRHVVSRFEGSTAIAALSSDDSNYIYLALRGGGQGLFIGLGNDEYMIASEPYGVVEITDKYIRVDGETPHDVSQPVTSRGQVFQLDQRLAGTLEGLSRCAYDSTELEISSDDIVVSEVTTRDIDRGDYEHYLWKEINEAPRSFNATLTGKFSFDQQSVIIDNEVFPEPLQEKIINGTIKDILIIGQGTAAVAGLACGHFFESLSSQLNIKSTLATEVSGFALRDNMEEVLVIAVSQSGTTTDTNRTVDLLRDRGASVIAIVNRRGSDLTTKADGVCYTSSGRDVEMSVASTKAFYAQVAAGAYIAIATEYIRSSKDGLSGTSKEIISSLIEIPTLMKEVLSQSSHKHIADIARRNILSRRSWATVGNGPNAIAAREIRIKSSELCYKAIAFDVTEDKKHIDLSSEPLIIICATGMVGSTADDVAKEIAIYKAHKACPIVITDDTSERFENSQEVILVPSTNQYISFILATVAGHILGYESAKAIDETAKVLREARGALAKIPTEQLEEITAMGDIGNALLAPSSKFFEHMSKHEYDAVLDASDAVNLTKIFTALTPPFMTALLQQDCGGLQTPIALTNCAVSAFTRGIDQLTRPIDAIRHQAKTVTVGISRSDDTLLRSRSISYLLNAQIPRDVLQFPVIRTLLALDEMVETITGHTRYSIHGDITSGNATLDVIEQAGSAKSLTSRITTNPTLRGTKSLVAREQSVWIAKGRSDGRNVILIPEIVRSKTVGITLLHIEVKANDEISLQTRKQILEGYKQRLFAIKDVVTETQESFNELILAEIDIMELLTEPVVNLSRYWLK